MGQPDHVADRPGDGIAEQLTVRGARHPAWVLDVRHRLGAGHHLLDDQLIEQGFGLAFGMRRLDGAEAILTLRTLATNNDFDDYWAYHQQQEQLRIHNGRYWNVVIPT
ncbi:MAG TPA: hypothetical protein VHX38_30020 [Pseudonocardiaceae bacterium]|nr:hypothetical protein [Pseudonocardiaceae bacterium]